MARAFAFAACLSVAGLVFSPALGIGPDLPIRFDADPRGAEDPGTLTLEVDRAAVTDLRIELQLYGGGELLKRQEADAAALLKQAETRSQGSRLEIPLTLQRGLADDLEPGAYALKYMIQGQRTDVPGARPLRLQRWIYFLVEDEVRPLTLEQYSAIVDPVSAGLDADGTRTLIQTGRDFAEDVDLSKTERAKAVPLGRMGGLVQEERYQEKREGAPDDDRSEADED